MIHAQYLTNEIFKTVNMVIGRECHKFFGFELPMSSSTNDAANLSISIMPPINNLLCRMCGNFCLVPVKSFDIPVLGAIQIRLPLLLLLFLAH